MFTVYHSNQIDILKSLLVELIRRDPLPNPFAKEHILVQSSGMSQWLKMELAQEFNVVANVEFALPAAFIWDLFNQVLDGVPKKSAFNKESMSWKLMLLLPKLLDRPEFTPLLRYLEDDEDQSKLYQLAEKIADTFDGYLVYRPEWVAKWEAGELVTEIEGEHEWQPILWQELYDYTVQQGQSPYHRANLYQHFIETLESYSGTLTQLPKRLFVFGISSLPPRYLDALKAIGEHIDVHLMFTNPCRYYWGEVRDRKYLTKLAVKHRQHIEWQRDHSQTGGETEQLKGTVAQNVDDELHASEVGNSLLASMGKLGRDNLYLLSQLNSHEVEAFVEVERLSLLHNLQADILNLEEHQDDREFEASQHKQVIASGDSSVSVHSCHSALREVEVLHDQLLAMFDDDPSLTPRDIIVMVADINSYSPAIAAVFGNASADRYIPYSLSDLSAEVENPILTTFIRLLELPSSRCMASELLEILETPAIMEKLALSSEEFDRLKLWTEESGIRWGLEPETGSEFDVPSIRQNTWQFGIQRMLLGYAMSQDSGLFEQPEQSLAPFEEVQGMDAVLAGKLSYFIQLIGQYRRQLAQAQFIEQWKGHLFDLLDDFFSVDIEGEVALKTIRDAIGQLQDNIEQAHFDHALSPAIVTRYLKDSMCNARVSQRFLAGQVNFCTLMPMRSVPFKVVCLLGMNDGVYPRSIPPESFDLMASRARAGDRSRRVDDRYLFLEALLSAQKRLYVSYIGRSIQNNSERVASILVSELLEYCQQNYCLEGDQSLSSDDSGQRLVEEVSDQHAMTPFSPESFSGRWGSYAREWLPVLNRSHAQTPLAQETLPPYLTDSMLTVELDFKDLQRFWRLPVQQFFNQRLKVYFTSSQTLVDDQEPFNLDGLTSFNIRQQLLDTYLRSEWEAKAGDFPSGLAQQPVQQKDEYFAQQRAQGKLPVGYFGDMEFEALRERVDLLFNELRELCAYPQPDTELVLAVPIHEGKRVVQLTGWLSNHFSSGYVFYRPGDVRAQDYLAAWLQHVALAAAGLSKSTHLVGASKDKYKGAGGAGKIVHKCYPPIDDQVFAQQLLTQFIGLYAQGMDEPLPFFPNTALANVAAEIVKGEFKEDLDKSLQKMKEAFVGQEGGFGGDHRTDGKNAYVARVWPEWNDELALQVRHLSNLVMQSAFLQAEDFDTGK